MPAGADPPEQRKRPAAPISASAFSFTLGPPAKKAKPPAPPPAARKVAIPAPNPNATPKKPVVLGSLPSPFALSPATPQRTRLTAVLEDPASPFRRQPKPAREDTPGVVGLTALPKVQLAAVVHAQREDEGVGVSPRKNKGTIVHKGPGPPPSVRLVSLLAASNTSLVLFYTAMQHALGPTARHRTTPAKYARSAPGRLAIVSPVPGPTHVVVMFRCRVISWRERLPDDEVVVVLTALPSDCPRVGVDPRVAASPGKPLEIGVWEPWSDRHVPSHPDVLFLSRYLIAEAE
ncbi:uncharacterized protein LOC62_02G002416 [Vanrija pseudolonga]|uniref:Uncharacterized protein n=1 Tax=Vanrija pseudolonga TaxID=143232 RepID=A0AAF0Y691_9TREE|nr:hypothetical protein LOC62_02G002416 [Vanrija pseudolonga]